MRISWSVILIIALISSALLLSFSFSSDQPSSQKANTPAESGHLPQVIHSVVIAKEHDFAGEFLPKNDDDVRERLEKELLVNSYRHSATIRYLKLIPRYFPLIENILEQEGLPEDFKYLALAESGLEQVVSPSGAKGLWQFMKGTALEFDLEVGSEVDERYHVEKSTRAACTYLKQLKEQFGSWTLAAAAYNMGQTALAREMKNQKETSYYNLNLSRETMRYIFRIVALKELHQNPEQYGYYLESDDYYQPLDDVHIVSVNQPIESLADLAHTHQTTYRELKRNNPWLLSHTLKHGKKGTYYIQLPKK